MCADVPANQAALIAAGCDKRKAYCGSSGPSNFEVCYDPDKLEEKCLGECELDKDCDTNDDCQQGLLCADVPANQAALIAAGFDKRKAYCGSGGPSNFEVCYNPCKVFFLSLDVAALYALVENEPNESSNRIGQYCYVSQPDPPGACKYYAKGRPRGFGDGVVPNDDGGGTGCVLDNEYNTNCYMDIEAHPELDDRLTLEESRAMCTPDFVENAVNQIRWAIKYDYCTDEGELLECD